MTQQASFQRYMCGVCGRESWSHTETIACVHSHTKAELKHVYQTGGYVPQKC